MMTLFSAIIILLFGYLTVCNGYDSVVHVRGLYQQMKDIRGRSSVHSPADECIPNCFNQLNQSIEQDERLKLYVKLFKGFDRFKNEFEPVTLRKYCQRINDTVSCCNGCNENKAKEIAIKSLARPKYLCIEHDFITHAPCFNKVSNSLIQHCHSDEKCGSEKEDLDRLFDRPANNVQHLEITLSAACEYYSCIEQCERPKLIEECGVEAANLFQSLFKRFIDSTYELFECWGGSITRSRECQQLGRTLR